MSAALSALTPIFLLIGLGYVVKRRRLIDHGLWKPAESLTYYVFFPALLLVSLARADLTGLPLPAMAGALLAAVAAATVAAVLSRSLVPGSDRAAWTSIVQGAIRPNTYVGIAAAVALYGDQGLALMALAVVVVVPTVNVVSVAVLVHADQGNRGARAVLSAVVRNPLVLACLGGGGLNFLGLDLPPPVGPTLEILGRAALPVGLLAVGAGLDFGAIGRNVPAVAVAGTLKLVLSPLVAFAVGTALGLSGVPLAASVLYAGLPVSASAYVLARQMGGDAPLMAGIITASTLAAMATLPLAVAAFE